MNGIKVTLFILTLMHLLPIVITQLLVLEYSFADKKNGKVIKRISTAANVILNCLALLLVILVYHRRTELNILKVLNFECSYQDISRIAISDVVCLVIAVLIGVGEYMCLCAYYQDKCTFRISSKCILLLSFAAIPIIGGYDYGYSGKYNLELSEICRKTTAFNEAEYLWDENASYVEIRNNGTFSYELDRMCLYDNEDGLYAKSLHGEVVKPDEVCRYIMSGDDSLDIEKNGGTIVYLSDMYGTVIDSVEVPALQRDESYKNTELGWVTVNHDEYAVKVPEFSAESGFYNESFYLTLSADEGTKIYYTTDSSDPTKDSAQYLDPILIYDKTPEPNVLLSIKNIITDYHESWTEQENVDKAFVVRAVAVDNEGNTSEIVTKTFFVDLDKYADRRVVSLVTDPVNLYGENGIYVTGDDYDEWYEDAYSNLTENDDSLGKTNIDKANFWKRGTAWERIANIEAFDNKTAYLNQFVGIRIQGNNTRNIIRKRFSVYARKYYSKSKYFDRSPFDGTDESVHSVVLRDGFENSFSQALVEDRLVSTQKSVPVTVFLNGEFLYDTYMQEKYSESYFANEYGLSEGNIEVLRIGNWYDLSESEKAAYINSITNYIENNDLSYDDKYIEFGEVINIQSYIDFACVNVYLGNVDLDDTTNVALWRTNIKENNEFGDTRWYWAFYDMDLGTIGARRVRDVETDAEVNTFTDGTFYMENRHFNTNPIFVALKANSEFCKQFVLTFMDLVNTTFSVENVAAKFEEWEEYTIESYNDGFFLNRDKYIVPFMAEEFELNGTQETVTLSSNISGTPITLNTITPELGQPDADDHESDDFNGSYIWNGIYFTDYPVTVTAKAPDFSHWEVVAGGSVGKYTDTTIEVPVSEGGVRIHAVFK